MAAESEPSREPTIPYPPRFWWLKRILIAVALLLFALGGLRWGWGNVAEGRTRAIVDAAHAAGEPILPEDFAPATIPDPANAAVTLQHAANAIVTDANSDWMDTKWNGDLSPATLARIDRIAANNATALQLARHAKSQPRADWGLVVRSPVMLNLPLSHFSPQRELAKLQQWVALRDHAKGNDAEALERVLDLQRQTDAIEEGSLVVLVTDLVADGLQGLTCEAIGRIAPDLKVVDDRAASTAASGGATRVQVRAVIAALLDESRPRLAASRAWEGERMVMLDAANYVAQGRYSLPSQPLAWVFKPMFILDGNRLATDLSQARYAAGLADRPAAVAALPQRSNRDASDLGRIAYLLSTTLASPPARLMQARFRNLAERRAAAIELALRLYRVNHGGRWPAALAELVPDYLPAVPADAMAAGGRPFGYHPSSTPPVIYSVGDNGIDDGGTSLPGQSLRWSLADAVFPLLPEPPSTQPASVETQDDQ